jgi:hypothetical protein
MCVEAVCCRKVVARVLLCRLWMRSGEAEMGGRV